VKYNYIPLIYTGIFNLNLKTINISSNLSNLYKYTSFINFEGIKPNLNNNVGGLLTNILNNTIVFISGLKVINLNNLGFSISSINVFTLNESIKVVPIIENRILNFETLQFQIFKLFNNFEVITLGIQFFNNNYYTNFIKNILNFIFYSIIGLSIFIYFWVFVSYKFSDILPNCLLLTSHNFILFMCWLTFY
jgi:hypothetical protein